MKYLLVLCFMLLVSCRDQAKSNLTEIVKEWEGKEVKFPSVSVFTRYVCDTVEMNKKTDFKLVVYVDSIGCTSCKLHLNEWKLFLYELDSISNGRASCFFYVCPQNKKELEHILKRDKFDYPICVDEYDSLNKLNHFPTDPRLQVFLLDKGNKVIAIGNPVLNPKIRNLYFNVISGKNDVEVKQISKTKATISEQMINMESFSWKEKQQKVVILRNIGHSPLVIDEIITSCGCTTVEYDKKPILPQDSLCVRIVYQSERPEYFDKTVTIYCNAESSPFQLRIRGNAK